MRKFLKGFIETTQFCEKVAAHTGQKMIRLERWLQNECINNLESGFWTEGHPNCHRSIQLHNWRGCELSKRVVQSNDAFPICLVRSTCLRVTGCDCRLQTVWTQRTTNSICAEQRRKSTLDEKLIPSPTILFQYRNRLS